MTPTDRTTTIIATYAMTGRDHLATDPCARLHEDLGIDDIDRNDMAMTIEDDLRIEVSDAEVSAWLTVADVIACVALCARRVA